MGRHGVAGTIGTLEDNAPPTDRRRGAYGLCVRGLEGAGDVLLAAPAHWPELEVVRVDAPGDAANAGSDSATFRPMPNGAEIGLGSLGSCVVERSPLRASFALRRAPTDAELVHPYLASVAAVAGRWLGHEGFHAGGFVLGSHCWAVLGERGAGKSTILASLAREGHAVVADDLLVLRDLFALSGPRSIDLRQEAAEHLGAGEALGVTGARERWRLPIGPVPAELPLGGWVFLEWGPLELRRLSAPELLTRLVDALVVQALPTRPESLLALAVLPAFVLVRPRGWDEVVAGVETLVDRLS